MSFAKSFSLAASISLFFHSKYISKSSLNTSEGKTPTTRNAICILYPNNSEVTGIVSFSQENIISPTKIVCSVKGLKPNSSHGFHIHEFGDLTEGCSTAGGHYNPFNKKHGGPLDEERHAGDLGNLHSDANGIAYLSMTDNLVKLFGETSVIGRSCVVHADQDDLGKGGFNDSLITGHAGARVACGVIALTNSFKNIKFPDIEKK